MDSPFLVFGSQYYRAPTPLREDWESDLKNIKEHGFNTIKIWAQWRTNNPQEGVYCFDDLIELLDIAEKNNLNVIINIILDVAPAWFFKKFPESIMVMADGRNLFPQSLDCRQIGGAPGPCYHHPKANEYKNTFVEQLAQKLGDHPALLIWDLWNEPELTCNIAREANVLTMVCYCDNTYNSFIKWLMNKYKTIQALNGSWQRNYNDYCEIELPRARSTFNDMIDWRTFFADTLVLDLENRVKCIKKYDKKHPVMIHTVPPPYFDMINACCDDYKMAKHCDLFGNSIGSFPFPVALNVSSANGKEVMNAEIHATGGKTFDPSGIATFNDFKRHIFTPFSRGIKGFLFWQYKPEILGLESPAWGLTNLEGNSTDNLQYAKRINNMLQEHVSITATCKPKKSRIAIIKDNNNEIFSWCSSNSLDIFNNSLFGAFNAFYKLNYNVEIITAEQLIENGMHNYNLIFYPLPYYISEEIASTIQNWVERGGVFVSEAFFGAYRAENCLHSKIVPGFGFDNVFGLKELRATTASKFIEAYGEKYWKTNDDIDIIPIHYKEDDEEFDLSGYYFYEELLPSTGMKIGSFGNETASIVENNFGKGKAVFIGSLVGCGYEVTKSKGNLKFFELMAKKANVERFVNVSKENIRADVLYADTGIALVIENADNFCGSVSFSFNSDKIIKSCIEIENHINLNFNQENDKIKLTINIDEYDIKIIIFNC